MSALDRLDNLTGLSLWLSPVNDDTLAHLPVLPALTTLSLSGTKVTAKGLVHLKKQPKLNNLDLSGCDLGDEAVETLLALPLFQLSLERTRVSEEAKAYLWASWSKRSPTATIRVD